MVQCGVVMYTDNIILYYSAPQANIIKKTLKIELKRSRF